jgi:DNA-binding response OmpR family regulator
MVIPKAHILAINRNQRNLELLQQFLKKEGYETHCVSTLDELDQILDQKVKFGIALIDISGFDRSIWGYCEKLSQVLPLLVISPQQTASIREESLAHGAQGVLFKPLVLKELAGLIRNMIREDAHE